MQFMFRVWTLLKNQCLCDKYLHLYFVFYDEPYMDGLFPFSIERSKSSARPLETEFTFDWLNVKKAREKWGFCDVIFGFRDGNEASIHFLYS